MLLKLIIIQAIPPSLQAIAGNGIAVGAALVLLSLFQLVHNTDHIRRGQFIYVGLTLENKHGAAYKIIAVAGDADILGVSQIHIIQQTADLDFFIVLGNIP